MKKKPLDEAPYKVYAKIGNILEGPDKGKALVVSYKSRNLISTYNMIKKKHGSLYWMNVWDRKEGRELDIRITNNQPPASAKIKNPSYK